MYSVVKELCRVLRELCIQWCGSSVLTKPAVAGFNPRWYESCVFTVRVPELAVVRFVVKDEDRGYDDFIGYYSLPFSSMQEGA